MEQIYTQEYGDEHWAGKQLGLSASTLQNWRHLGRGPAYHKIGGRIIYSLKDLEEYRKKCRIDPESKL